MVLILTLPSGLVDCWWDLYERRGFKGQIHILRALKNRRMFCGALFSPIITSILKIWTQCGSIFWSKIRFFLLIHFFQKGEESEEFIFGPIFSAPGLPEEKKFRSLVLFPAEKTRCRKFGSSVVSVSFLASFSLRLFILFFIFLLYFWCNWTSLNY